MDLLPRILVPGGILLVLLTLAFGVFRLLKGAKLVREATLKDWLQGSSSLSARLFYLFMILTILALIVAVVSK